MSKPPTMTSIVPPAENQPTEEAREAGTPERRSSLPSVPGSGTAARSSMTLPIRRTVKPRPNAPGRLSSVG